MKLRTRDSSLSVVVNVHFLNKSKVTDATAENDEVTFRPDDCPSEYPSSGITNLPRLGVTITRGNLNPL